MSVRKICALTILSREEPASVRTAESAFRAAAVLSPTVPSTMFPCASAGSWPEQYIACGVLMACLEMGQLDLRNVAALQTSMVQQLYWISLAFAYVFLTRVTYEAWHFW